MCDRSQHKSSQAALLSYSLLEQLTADEFWMKALSSRVGEIRAFREGFQAQDSVVHAYITMHIGQVEVCMQVLSATLFVHIEHLHTLVLNSLALLQFAS